MAVVVCSRDRPAQLARSLAAIGAVLGPDDELTVVDSASVDAAEVARVAAEAGAVLVREDVPGLSRARNAGVAHTRAPLVAFTDDDCRPRPGWLDGLVHAFDDPLVGVVAGRVVGEATGSPAGGATVTTMTGEEAKRFEGWCDPIDLVHGANMAFRRVALEAAGRFDELLGAGGRFRAGEDHDMSFRVVAAGWAARYEPAAVIGHSQWRGRSAVLRLEFGYGLGAGAFAAKVARLDRAAGRRLLGRRLWDNGVARAWHELAAGHEMGAAVSLLKVAGVVTGIARSAALPLDGPRYRSD